MGSFALSIDVVTGLSWWEFVGYRSFSLTISWFFGIITTICLSRSALPSSYLCACSGLSRLDSSGTTTTSCAVTILRPWLHLPPPRLCSASFRSAGTKSPIIFVPGSLKIFPDRQYLNENQLGSFPSSLWLRFSIHLTNPVGGRSATANLGGRKRGRFEGEMSPQKVTRIGAFFEGAFWRLKTATFGGRSTGFAAWNPVFHKFTPRDVKICAHRLLH